MKLLTEGGRLCGGFGLRRGAAKRVCGSVISLGIVTCLGLFAFAAAGQINLPPGWNQVPQGTGACSVEKSCAELAPAMIQSALTGSALEENLRLLGRSKGRHATESQAEEHDVDWAVDSFRRAGASGVKTEKLAFPAGSSNVAKAVVWELLGREQPKDFIVLCANLNDRRPESDTSGGAGDAAALIDAARVIQASGNLPRRSIRFAVFIGSKPAPSLSRAYVVAHRAELDHLVAAIALRVGVESMAGYSLGGRRDTQAAVREALAPVRALGVKEFTLGVDLHSDAFDFFLEGVPTLTAEALPHSAPPVRAGAESPDSESLNELKRHAAIAAVTAYALADAETRIGPRQTRAEIAEMLKDTGIGAQMKRESLWSEWEKGERGRYP